MNSSNKEEIQALRKDIDHIDNMIASALVQRHLLSQKVQAIKLVNGQNKYSPEREQEILSQLKKIFPQIPALTLENIYREIFDWMRPKG